MHTTILTAALALGALQASPTPVPAANTQAARYDLDVGGPGTLAVGKNGSVRVTVKPTAGWHMNLDFPTSLTLTSSDGIALGKAKLKKSDAKRLDADGLVFVATVTGKAAGSHNVQGKLKFAVCQAEACAPVREAVAVKIAVK